MKRNKCLRKIIYVIASEMKCSEAISKTEAIATQALPYEKPLRVYAPLAADKYILNFAQLLSPTRQKNPDKTLL